MFDLFQTELVRILSDWRRFQYFKGKNLNNTIIDTASSDFDLAKLHIDRGDLKKGASLLEGATPRFLQQKDFKNYLKTQNLLLRIYAEMLEVEKINITKDRIQDLVIKEDYVLTSRTFYTLGVCSAYKQQYKSSQDYFEKSLRLGLESDSKEDICYAISGLANVYWLQQRYDDALKEIYNLQVFFQLLPQPELQLSSLLLNGHILRKVGKYNQALDVLWQAYDALKEHKNLFMYVSLLYAMGATYADSGESNMALVYLNLAKRSCDSNNLKYLSQKIKARLEELGSVDLNIYDLVLEGATNTVMEKQKGRVDFKSQFILLDLLRLFMNSPGETHSKEALVKKVWKQEYDPSVHDNKVYVTIKRLRKLIEPDYDKPRYIFRSKNGYYLNKNTRVLVN